jgi:hypothetical protein
MQTYHISIYYFELWLRTGVDRFGRIAHYYAQER